MATTYNKRPALTKVMTPEGTFVWPRLNEPDFKFKKESGEFQCRVRLERTPEVEKIISLIESQAQQAYDDEVASLKAKLSEATTGQDKAKLKERIAKYEMASLPFKDDVDDEGEPNGSVIFNFKMKHKVSYKDKTGKTIEKLLYPKIFDAAGTSLKSPPLIYGGTTGHVAGELVPFAAPLMAGVSLRLGGVQIIELVSAGGEQSAESYGFGKKDGYAASEEDTTPVKAAADDAESTGETDEEF